MFAPIPPASALEDPTPREATQTLYELAPLEGTQFEDIQPPQTEEQSESSDNPVTCKVLEDLKQELRTSIDAGRKD